MPGATIEVTNAATGALHAGVSDASGYGQFAPLPRGVYTVHVSLPGFQSIDVTNVRVDVNERRFLPVTLAVAAHMIAGAAERRGLDFVAITDHNTTSHHHGMVEVQERPSPRRPRLDQPPRARDRRAVHRVRLERARHRLRARGRVEVVNGRNVTGPTAGEPVWHARLNEGHRLTGTDRSALSSGSRPAAPEGSGWT